MRPLTVLLSHCSPPHACNFYNALYDEFISDLCNEAHYHQKNNVIGKIIRIKDCYIVCYKWSFCSLLTTKLVIFSVILGLIFPWISDTSVAINQILHYFVSTLGSGNPALLLSPHRQTHKYVRVLLMYLPLLERTVYDISLSFFVVRFWFTWRANFSDILVHGLIWLLIIIAHYIGQNFWPV